MCSRTYMGPRVIYVQSYIHGAKGHICAVVHTWGQESYMCSRTYMGQGSYINLHVHINLCIPPSYLVCVQVAIGR